MERVAKHLVDAQKSNAAAFDKLSGEDAAKLIASSSHEDEQSIGFELAEGTRLGVKLGDTVSVTPVDNGKLFCCDAAMRCPISEMQLPTQRRCLQSGAS